MEIVVLIAIVLGIAWFYVRVNQTTEKPSSSRQPGTPTSSSVSLKNGENSLSTDSPKTPISSSTTSITRQSTYTTTEKPTNIQQYRTTQEIVQSGKFTPQERAQEYRRRGKSPSGVIDGVYNDMYLEKGKAYNDTNRDWDADA